MALDLSALEEKPAIAAQSTGEPLEISLTDIEEDPNQPRKEFSEEAMQEMIDSIRTRGVKTPVSVRSHPSKPGKWMLNYGARRYRGSQAAGCDTIPAFIDETHDEYDQVIENIQRDDLKPMELALFIKKRLDAGDQKKAIAKNLGKDNTIITQHLALIDPPTCIEDAYSTGKCQSPKTLYELRSLHEKYPEQVEAWYAATVEVTRKTVTDLAYELKSKKNFAESIDVDAQDGEDLDIDESGKFGHDQIFDGTGEDQPHNGGKGLIELTNCLEGRAVSNPYRISKPLMLVEFDGRLATVLLNHCPSTPGLIHIRFEDGGGDQEVDAGACKINLLTDAEK